MITLFWCPKTRASRILWLLEELKQPFEVRLIDIRDPAARSDPDFRAASPMGKVPAIEDRRDDATVRVADSAAIALYLADRYPQAGLAPGVDDPQRGDYLYWMTYTPGVIEPAMMERFNKWEVSRATSGWGNFDTMIEVLRERLSTREWLLGARFSAADVLVGSSVYFMKLFGALSGDAVLDPYLERCLARPANVAALARDAELDS
jgi:glutathione S-transferase